MSHLLSASDMCAGCNKPPPKSEFMRCLTCKAVYDLECINLSTQRFYSFYKLDKNRRDSWKCPACNSKKPKNDNQNTPVRSARSPDPTCNVTQRVKTTPAADMFDISANNIQDIDQNLEEPAVELRKFCEEMRAVRMEISMFRSVILELTEAIKSQNLRLDSLENRVKDLETKTCETDTCKISELEGTIVDLKLEIEERNQDLLGNDIEIASFPEISSENTTHVMLTIANKLGVDLDERDVVSAQRVGALRAAAGAGDVSGGRPRPIAVRLARRAPRDALLHAARVRRHLTVSDMVAPGTQALSPSRPFYINERLTYRNRLLFQKVREVAKRLSWKYVWTREGKIFARQETGMARHRVRSETDLIRVFGAESVGDTTKKTNQ